MSKANKFILILISLIIVGSACYISWSYGFRQGFRTADFIGRNAIGMLSGQHFELQLENASCEGVKQAILDYMATMDKLKTADDSIIFETTYNSDKLLGYVRMARIEEYLGNISEKDININLAIEACKKLKWNDCSETGLYSFAKKFEERFPIACIEDKK